MKANSSKRLNELMEYFGITQTDIVQKTGIPKSAISMYLSGQRSPRQNRLSDIAEAYGVSEAWLMGYDVPMTSSEKIVNIKKKEPKFSDSDIKLISDFHSLDPQGQETVRYILDNEKKRCEKISELDSRIEKLENKISKELIPESIWAYYGKIAAAGKSFEFGDITAGTIKMPLTDKNRNADYTIGVSGDSMEPTYYDGDIVYVQKTTHLNIGDIGIFQKDNGIYIKEVGENGLISHNKKYEPMVSDSRVYCLGKVIGKIDE